MGAKGYLMKSSVGSVLPALYAIERGQRVFGDEIVDRLPPLLNQVTINNTKREVIILLNLPTRNLQLLN